MASGSFNLTRTGSTSSYVNFVCNWSSYSNGTSANSSTVTLNIVASKSSSSSSNTWGTYNASATVNGSSQSVGNTSFTLKPSGSLTLLSKSYTVAHNSDGTKSTTISASVGGDVMWGSGSATITLDKIPRQASLSSAPNFNDEENPTITYSNPAGNSVTSLDACISLTGSVDDIPYRSISKTGTSYTFSLTDEERTTLRNATTTSNSRTIKFYVRTIISGTTYYSILDKTLSIINASPTIGTFTYKDNKTATTNITGNNQRIIRNNSNLVFTIGTATAKKGATISKYEVTFNGVTKSRTSAGDLDFGTINLSSNATATLKVTDSRGNTATKQITVIIDDWVLPTGLINIQRKNNYYSETYIKVDGTCSSLNGKNSMTIQYKYKKVSDSSYSSLANLTDNVQETLTLDNQQQWNLVVVISDKIGQTTYNLFVDRGMPIIYYDRKKSSVGINTFPTENEALRVAGGNINIENTGTDVGYQQGGNMILRHNLGVTVVSGSGGDVMLRPKGSTDSSVQFKITQKGTISVNDVSVIAYGSYSFGNYVKFYDGTMIQWNYEEVTDQAINNAYGSLYQGTRTITYPVAFVGNPPVLTCSMFKYGTSASWGTTTENDTPLTKGTLRGIDAYFREAGTTCRIGWFAIGRWKS